MVDLETPPAEKKPDPTTRSAALWATAIAVPVALLAGFLMFWQLMPSEEPAGPQAGASAAPVPTTPVEMSAPRLDERATRVCLAVASQMPATLRDLPARKVTAGPEQNAAYGEPPITVSCGVPQPAMCERVDGGAEGCVPLDATMLKMDNVCWWGVDGPASDVYTTMDREVAVRVTVPSGYEQSAQWANEFSEVVVKTVLSRSEGLPSGCR